MSKFLNWLLGFGAEVEVWGEGDCRVSQGVQTGDEEELVQIKATFPEVRVHHNWLQTLAPPRLQV